MYARRGNGSVGAGWMRQYRKRRPGAERRS